jgi:hypothetical protein
LTGIGDGFPHDEPLRDLMPVRHGIDEIWVDNGACDASILPKCRKEIRKKFKVAKFN